MFDLIIPIVDYTNYAIVGITCAMAWELPSKPPSEIIENFRHKLNDGTFGLIRRNDSVAINSFDALLQQESPASASADKGGNQQKLSATVAATSSHSPMDLYYNPPSKS